MQTFLPYPNFLESAKCLDYKRLGKQRVEAMQLLNGLLDKTKNGWRNHPCSRMWAGYRDALGFYMNCMIKEWIFRGYNNTMKLYELSQYQDIKYPHWLGYNILHSSHRSNLLRKDPAYYSKFDWLEPDNLPYFWPS